jgi:hypothetical protein
VWRAAQQKVVGDPVKKQEFETRLATLLWSGNR